MILTKIARLHNAKSRIIVVHVFSEPLQSNHITSFITHYKIVIRNIMFHNSNRLLLLIAVAILCSSLFVILFIRGFSDPDEGRYSEIPREMVESGNWLEMRMLGYRYYEKPPLAYWIVAPAISLLGARDWAVRVPLLINTLMIIALFYVIIRKRWPCPSGTIALLTAVSTAGFLAGTSILLTDSFLVLWFSLTCAFLFWGFQSEATSERRWLFLMLASVAATLGFLTKGALAIVLPAAILLLWLIWERRLASLLTLAVPAAGLLIVLLTAPMLWLIEQHNPGFVHHFLVEEHIGRFMGTRPIQLHPEPFWFYAPIILLLMVPWALFAFRAVRTMALRRVLTSDSPTRFFVVWMLVVVIFFSISRGKLMSYILPAIFPLALVIGRWGVAPPPDDTRQDRWLWNIGKAGLLITALAIIVIWTASFFQLLPDKIYPISGISAVALIPMCIAFCWVVRARKFRCFSGLLLFNSGILLTTALFLSPLAGKDFNVLIHINSSHVYKRLAGILKPEDRIVVFWSYRPALPFYTQRLYIPFQHKNELVYGMRLEPERQAELQSVEELHRIIRTSPGRVYALIEPKALKTKFQPLGLRYAPVDLPQDPDTIVLELLSDSGQNIEH